MEASYGSADVRLATALHNVGGFYVAQRGYASAQPYYERALKVLSSPSKNIGPAGLEHGNGPSMLAIVWICIHCSRLTPSNLTIKVYRSEILYIAEIRYSAEYLQSSQLGWVGKGG